MKPVDLARRVSGRFGYRTPTVLQTEAAECGLACMAMIAGHFGHAIDLAGLRRQFLTSLKGMTLRDLVTLGESLNLATRAVRVDLDDMPQLRLPCILHWNHNHFVVLTRISGNSVTIHDPALGRRKISRDELSKRFTGVALEAWPTAGFRKQSNKSRVRVTDLIRRTRGIGRAALNILAISLLLEVVTIAMPIGFQLVLDEVVVAADYELLTLIVIALGLLLVLQVAGAFLRAWLTMSIGSSLTLQWKVSLFDQLTHLPLGFFEKRHVGDVVSRFGSLDSIQRTLTTGAITAILDGVMSIALIAMIWLYGGWLLLVVLASTLLYAGFRLIAYLPFRAMSEEAIVYAAQENSHFMESVRGMASVKALSLEERRRGVWINHLVDRVNADLKVQRFGAIFDAASNGFFGIDRLLLIFLGARAVLAGDMSVGMLVAFLAYRDQFSRRIDGLIDTSIQFFMLSLHGERVSDIALGDREVSSAAADRPPIAALQRRDGEKPGSLELRGVQFRYADNEPAVLEGIDLKVAQRECIGIAGPSGSGKTTLLKIMAGLAVPTDGRVLVDGVPLTPAGLHRYRRRVGCVLQDDQLFAGSIAENIVAFDAAPDRTWLETCARLAAIDDEIRAMPMGYETLVGDMGSTLSGGQRQRIVLARALYRRPSILFLDEATSHLDHANETAINEALKRLPITRIIVAHRTTTLTMTDRVVSIGGSSPTLAPLRMREPS